LFGALAPEGAWKGFFKSSVPSRERLGYRKNGMVLPLVLVVVAMLSLAAYTFSELMLTEYKAAIVNERQAQTRTFADTGVELMQDFVKEIDDLQLQAGGRYNNPGYFQGVLVADAEQARERGRFSILVPNIANEELAGVRYGVEDESTRLNLNTILLADQINPGGASALLMALPGMTPEAADSILDWLDPDEDPRENGGETAYYSGLGYACKNGPLDTIEELLLVKGVTPDLLFGRDSNRNGMIDAGESNNPSLAESTAMPTEVDRGWAAYLTLYSLEANVTPDGLPRIDLNAADLQQLHDDLAAVFDGSIVDFIIAYRQFGPYTGNAEGSDTAIVQLDYTQPGNTQLTSVLDLVGAKVRITQNNQNQNQNQNGQQGQPMGRVRPRQEFLAGLGVASNLMPLALLQAQDGQGGGRGGQGGGRGGQGGGQGNQGQGNQGQGNQGQGNQGQGNQGQNNEEEDPNATVLVSPFPDNPLALATVLPEFLDYVTVNKAPTIPGRININQASPVILRGIPGMTEEIVQRIISERELEYTGNRPAHRHEHWLLCEGIVTLNEMKQMVPFICAGGRVFRAQVVGYFDEDGPSSRVEAVVNVATIEAGLATPRVVFWRDLTNLGRGYNLATLGVGAQ
jgi:DNA uptake protein ComE-like DNA-binding protein